MINSTIKYLIKKYKLDNGFFCIYGSYATNSYTSNSDIDLLFICSDGYDTPIRISEKYNNVDISFYLISKKELMRDANGKYGGFFCGKVFNPHILINNTINDEEFIMNNIVLYFARLLSEKHFVVNKIYDKDEILKGLILIYMSLYPEYFAYILRLYKNKDFKKIWNDWKNNITEALCKHNVLKEIENGYTFNEISSIKQFESLKIDYISRFWIFGAIVHDSNIGFYDLYKNKNIEYINSNYYDVKSLEKFLNEM